MSETEKITAPVYGVLLVFLSAVGFSAKAIMVKLAYRYSVDAITLLALRMIFSLPFFLFMAFWSQRDNTRQVLNGRDWRAIIMLGLMGYYMASFLDFLGLVYITASLERLILFLYPTMVVVLSALFLGKRITRRDMVALILGYGGILLVVVSDLHVLGDHARTVTGSLLVFGSGLAYAIYLIGSGQTIGKVGAVRFTAYAMTISSLACIVQFALTHHVSALLLPAQVYGLGLGMAVFSTVLPAFMLSAGIRHIGANRASMVGSIGPVVTIFLGYIFLGEAITLVQLAGAALVLGGVLLVSSGKSANAT